MAISQFDKYFGNEYVPQVAPVPFDILMKVGQAKQQDWDAQEKKATELASGLASLNEGQRTKGWGEQIRADYDPRIQSIINADNFADPRTKQELNKLLYDVSKDQRIKTAEYDYKHGDKELQEQQLKDPNWNQGAKHKWLNPDGSIKQFDISRPTYEGYGDYTHYVNAEEEAHHNIFSKIQALATDETAKGARIYQAANGEWFSEGGGRAKKWIDKNRTDAIIESEIKNFDPTKTSGLTAGQRYLIDSGMAPDKDSYRKWLQNIATKYQYSESKSSYTNTRLPGQNSNDGNTGTMTNNPIIKANDNALAPNDVKVTDNEYIVNDWSKKNKFDIFQTDDTVFPYKFTDNGQGMQKLQNEIIETPEFKKAAVDYLNGKKATNKTLVPGGSNGQWSDTQILDAALQIKTKSAINTKQKIINFKDIDDKYSENRKSNIIKVGDYANRQFTIEGSSQSLSLEDLATNLKDAGFNIKGAGDKTYPITPAALQNLLGKADGFKYAGIAPGAFEDQAGDVLNLSEHLTNTNADVKLPRVVMSTDEVTNKFHGLTNRIYNREKNSEFGTTMDYLTVSDPNGNIGRQPVIVQTVPIVKSDGSITAESTVVELKPDSYRQYITSHPNATDAEIEYAVKKGIIATYTNSDGTSKAIDTKGIFNNEVSQLANSPFRVAESQSKNAPTKTRKY